MTTGPGVRLDHDGDIVIAHVTGEIDLASASTVGDQLSGAIPNQALGVVVDLTETSYLDSSGVSLIFELAERLRRRQQQIRLVVPEEAPMRRILRIVDAGGTLPVLATVAEATSEIRDAA